LGKREDGWIEIADDLEVYQRVYSVDRPGCNRPTSGDEIRRGKRVKGKGVEEGEKRRRGRKRKGNKEKRVKRDRSWVTRLKQVREANGNLGGQGRGSSSP
jgi:hypothetical protein